jgi:acetyl-CoA C-acetyltransferase
MFGRLPEESIESLATRASVQAITESGLDREQIGALYLGNFISGPLNGKEVLAGIVADRLGLPGNIPCTKVEGACASGGIAFRHAWLAVAYGMCDAALVVGVEKMTHASTAQVTSALNCAMDNELDGPTGLTFPGLFGLAWRAYHQKYGLTREQVASVVIKNKRNGLRNPLAQMGAELSIEDIAASVMIADPLQLFDCCPATDGAAALLLCSEGLRRKSDKQSVRVLASVQTSGAPQIAKHLNLCTFEATVRAAEQAYAMAAIKPAQIDVVELHDCFSVAEIIDSEDLGVVPRGEGAIWASEGRTNLNGDVAINPSGGLLAKGHPVGATGVGQIYEVARQLRREHSNQVAGAQFGLTHNLGGTGVACTVNILGAAQ